MEPIAKLLPRGPHDPKVERGARRRAARFPLNAKVRLPGQRLGRRAGEDAHGVTLNASAGGLRVALEHELPLGEETTLEIDFGNGKVTQEQVRVVWSREEIDGHVVGVAFLEEG